MALPDYYAILATITYLDELEKDKYVEKQCISIYYAASLSEVVSRVEEDWGNDLIKVEVKYISDVGALTWNIDKKEKVEELINEAW